jgi:glutamate-1-semialdehyde aminotransferase
MRDTATPIAAVVIEPTQQSSGHSASDNFISSLNGMAKEFEAALVVDETSTGCHSSGSGSFWQYNGYADYVSFGKRTQASGFFSNENGVALAGNENDVRLFSTIQQGISEGGLATRHGDASQKIAQSVA